MSVVIFIWATTVCFRFSCSVHYYDRYGQVLLQVGYFITVSPVLQLGFVMLMKLRTIAWLYSSSPNYCW